MNGAETRVLKTAAVTTRYEREVAVSHWLLAAAQDISVARREWAENGIALLKCGGLFSAIRMRAELVHAAAGSDRLEDVDAYLAEVLDDGPVFVDTHAQRYYALVPPSTAWAWKGRERPGVVCLGRESFLGVPHPERTEPVPGRSYWCVPMDSPGELCDIAAVVELVRVGHARLSEEGAGQ